MPYSYSIFEFECSGVKLKDQHDGCHNVSGNGDAQ